MDKYIDRYADNIQDKWIDTRIDTEIDIWIDTQIDTQIGTELSRTPEAPTFGKILRFSQNPEASIFRKICHFRKVLNRQISVKIGGFVRNFRTIWDFWHNCMMYWINSGYKCRVSDRGAHFFDRRPVLCNNNKYRIVSTKEISI